MAKEPLLPLSEFIIEARRIAKDELKSSMVVIQKVEAECADLSARLTKLDSEIKSYSIPLLKDKRFWAGALTLPTLILGGWILDFLTNDRQAVLGIIHRALGSESAMIGYIKNNDEKGDVNSAISTMIAKKLDANHSELKESVKSFFGKEFVSTEQLKTFVTRELIKRENVKLASYLLLGQINTEKVETKECRTVYEGLDPETLASLELKYPKGCMNWKDGLVSSGVLTFTVNGDENIELEVAITSQRYTDEMELMDISPEEDKARARCGN